MLNYHEGLLGQTLEVLLETLQATVGLLDLSQVMDQFQEMVLFLW